MLMLVTAIFIPVAQCMNDQLVGQKYFELNGKAILLTRKTGPQFQLGMDDKIAGYCRLKNEKIIVKTNLGKIIICDQDQQNYILEGSESEWIFMGQDCIVPINDHSVAIKCDSCIEICSLDDKNMRAMKQESFNCLMGKLKDDSLVLGDYESIKIIDLLGVALHEFDLQRHKSRPCKCEINNDGVIIALSNRCLELLDPNSLRVTPIKYASTKPRRDYPSEFTSFIILRNNDLAVGKSSGNIQILKSDGSLYKKFTRKSSGAVIWIKECLPGYILAQYVYGGVCLWDIEAEVCVSVSQEEDLFYVTSQGNCSEFASYNKNESRIYFHTISMIE